MALTGRLQCYCLVRVILQVCAYAFREVRDFSLHDIPHDFEIYSKVLVNENVFQAGDSLPFDVDELANLIRNLLRCLADHFEVSNDSIGDFAALRKSSSDMREL